MQRVGVLARTEWADDQGMVPAQWRDLHVAEPSSGYARLYRAVIFDAMQGVGRYLRAQRRGLLSDKRQQERRELAAWLSARGVAAYGYKVPFQLAMAYGFPGLDVDAMRTALLVALQVIPNQPTYRLAFDDRVLRRHYVRRPQRVMPEEAA